MQFALLIVTLLSAYPLYSQDVGQGAPAPIEPRFVNAFYRNRFNALTSLPALGNVRRFGATGYLQEFADAKKNINNKFALVKANDNLALQEEGYDVFQIYPGLYDYYSSVGVNNAGYPTEDTALCSSSSSGAAGSVCSYQIFDKNYALFVYTSNLVVNDVSASYTTRNLFYTRWAALGGITALGPATSAEAAITSKNGITAQNQLYLNGVLYSITSGAHSGKVYPVAGKIYTLYTTLGLHTGSLGLPTSEELTVGVDKLRQNFEGGSIEYTATTEPVLRPAVGGVTLSISTTAVTRMNAGESITVRATVYATIGDELTDRDVAWITSNSRVVSIQPGGRTATLRAVSGGTAIITAVSEGKLSPSLTIFVAAPCCQIGEGAPTTAMQQSFQDAATRFRISVKLPAANPVRRAGQGYVQELENADNPAIRYLLCRSDRSPGVFLMTGDLLKAYEAEGGPAGRLGYPTADATAGGRQNFEGGALAGSPVQVVTQPILARWEALGYESGIGPPAGPARAYLSFTGVTGAGQPFRDGFLSKIETGPFAGTRVVLARGRILSRYGSLGGPDGALGFPFTEEYTANGYFNQDFEGGELRYRPDSDVEFIEQERKPDVSVSPNRVTAGSRVRVIVGGFPDAAALRISFTGTPAQPPFEVQTARGAYTWESPVPVNAPSSVITITAREAGTEKQASSSYSVLGLAEAGVQLTKVRGDTQTGLPGARLLNPLSVFLRDGQGTPLAGIPVKFSTTPGSQALDASEATDERGEAQAYVRVQNADGIVLANAEAAGKLVTFSALVAGASLNNFPRQTQAGSFTLGSTSAAVAQKGALLAAVSSILRYHQNRNEVPSSLGVSEPAALNDFLKNFCVFDTAGGRICDGYLTPIGGADPIVNLWRLRDFGGNNVDVEMQPAGENNIRDLLAQGSPVLLALSLSAGDLAGSHFVVATGVAGDGGILIHDPNPVLTRGRLSDYTGGFSLAGRAWKATLLNSLRLVPRSPSPTGFLVTSGTASIAVRSAAGECSGELAWPGAAAITADGIGPPATATAHLYYCGGLERAHIVQFTAQGPYQADVTDLGTPGLRSEINGNGVELYSLTRPSSQWQPGRVEVSVAAGDVLNAASFTPELAPGTLAAVFGTGLARPGAVTTAEIAGLEAVVQMATEFRLNVEIPPSTPPGGYPLRIRSPYGTVEAPVQIRQSAPAVFLDERTRRPMIVNAAGGQLNSPGNPVSRGGSISIYATGLGPVIRQANRTVTEQPVAVVLQGVEIAAAFSGPVAGFPGLYVVNVAIPLGAAPGLSQTLLLRQAGAESSAVSVSVR
ncbi:MAG: hypothetical protein HY235_18610 [Acidobacteria bacterium]|nr:hypothetical protein [Acidobacteriota bacterium]